MPLFPTALVAGSNFSMACAFWAEQTRAEAGARQLCASRACVSGAKGWEVAVCVIGGRLQQAIRRANKAA